MGVIATSTMTTYLGHRDHGCNSYHNYNSILEVIEIMGVIATSTMTAYHIGAEDIGYGSTLI